MRVLLDTNVVLDFVLERSQFFDEADGIFLKCRNKEIEAFVSPITPINFYTTRKEKGKDIAFKAVEGLIILVEICRIDKLVLQNAFRLGFTDFEDAVQCASAMAEDLDAIVTRRRNRCSRPSRWPPAPPAGGTKGAVLAPQVLAPQGVGPHRRQQERQGQAEVPGRHPGGQPGPSKAPIRAATMAPISRPDGRLTRRAYCQADQAVPEMDAALLVPSSVAGMA